MRPGRRRSAGAAACRLHRNILDNIISGTGGGGLESDSNLVEGNDIGTDMTGQRPSATGTDGIYSRGGYNTIGGAVPSIRATSSRRIGNTGILFSREMTGDNVIQGNQIGTDMTGMFALGNGGDGITISIRPGTRSAGTPQARGTSSRATAHSGSTRRCHASDNLIQGNVIGSNSDATAALPNGKDGVSLADSLNTVGGTIVGAGNIISGNLGNGITLSGYGNSDLIVGNAIGTDGTGTLHLGNGGDGVLVKNPGNTIGGTAAGAANTIAFNSLAGIAVVNNSTGNAILSNSIYSNSRLGIDLGGDGVTPNAPGGPHSGPNRLPELPVALNLAGGSAASTTISGTLNSTPDTAFTIQFFSSPTADPSGYGQGQTYLGELTAVRPTPSGNASFLFLAPVSSLGQFISATATDSGGNTSEFSQDIQSVPLPDVAVSIGGGHREHESGGSVAYTFTVTNDGPAPRRHNIVVTDSLPPSLAECGGLGDPGQHSSSSAACSPTPSRASQRAAPSDPLHGDRRIGRQHQRHPRGDLLGHGCRCGEQLGHREYAGRSGGFDDLAGGGPECLELRSIRHLHLNGRCPRRDCHVLC